MGMRTRAAPRRRRLGARRARSAGCRACAQADWYCVFAKTGPVDSRAHDSIIAFIVERSLARRVGRATSTRRWASRASTPASSCSTTSACPAENVVGEIGGFRLAMLGLNSMRPIVAARGIGLAEGALMYAVEYVKQREAFGKTIADFQGIQWKIAELAAEIEAARLLTYRAAWMADRGQFTKEWVPYLSMAKYYATELAVKVVERGAPDARRGRVHEGPPARAATTATRSSSRSSRGPRRCSSGSSRAACSTTICGGIDGDWGTRRDDERCDLAGRARAG